MRTNHLPAHLLLILLMLLAPALHAEGQADPHEALRREFEAAAQAMDAAKQKGPADIPLLQQAVLHLPAGYTFVPNPAAARFMAAMGNSVGEDFLGLVLPEDKGAEWVATLAFEKSGYIRDGDAKNWNLDDMLKTLRESADEMNQVRASRGIPGLELLGWAEPPAYDATNHRLVWALAVASKGAPVGQPQSVNYNTHALGREGYLSLNLVTSRDALATRKPIAQALLAAVEFNAGKRYEDFNAETDHIAEYGLAALVGGAMLAKKFGLLALAGVFIAKFGKLIALGAAAVLGLFGRRWGGKKGGGGSMDA